ncbi:hypothetical protein CLV71_12018 [Actinophytocola oryzae]|uniref:Phosphotransferase family enzyme n=2 Tax=Actinophytocola oryzae TaxID=502181 RepID=A0A4R7UWZ4_9PSEU|nr:hypothetical protein CLV71_12018 [Actinophytocola oryzae]
MQLAQLLSETDAPLRKVDHSGERKDVPALLAQAARLAIETQEFRQKVLGGRSETFVLDDPHRLMSATLVLKPTTRADAAIERQRTTSLKRHLAATRAPDWMVVPESLTEVPLVAPGDADTVYVTRRAKGTSLAEFAAQFPEKVTRHVPRVVRYLARIHGWLETETARARGDHWAAVQSVVTEYGDRIGVPDPNHLGAMVVSAVPHILPAVARRDAHAENWLVTPTSQIVALDLEGEEDLPLLYEVAQFIEDHALVPLGPDAWSLRAGLCQAYLQEFGHTSLDAADVESAYQAFALTRAVFVAGHVPRKVDRSSPSGSRRFAADRVRHAVKVAEWVATTAAHPLAECAGELSGPLRAASDLVLAELG